MKKIIGFTLAAAVVANLAFKAKDVLSDLGLTSMEVKNTVFDNIKSEWMDFPVTGKMRVAARNIPAGSQGAAITALGNVVRAYVESDEFRQRYNEYVDQTYRVDGPASEDEIDAKRDLNSQGLDAAAQNVTMALAAFDQIPDNMVPMMLQSLIQQQESELPNLQGTKLEARKKELADLKALAAKANTQPAEARKALKTIMAKEISGGVEEKKAEIEDEHQQAMQKLAQNKEQLAIREAHRDYNKVLKDRLRTFLELSATVDFDAKLQKSGSKWYFVNPAYEQKPEQWKFLYRIGKEPVTAARTFAANWLKELEGKAK